MTTCILYARFSPRRHGDLSESNDTQLEYCRRFAAERGWTIVAEFSDEQLSGDDAERPGLWDAINALTKGQVLLCYKYDRLARSVFLDEYIRREVEKRKARIEVVVGSREGDSLEDKLMRQILAAFAEYEKGMIGLRTKLAMRRHQATGRSMSGRPPYGKRFGPPIKIVIDGREIERATLIDDPHEEPIRQRILAMRADGINPCAIAAHLNRENVPARGRRWHRETISRLLNRS